MRIAVISDIHGNLEAFKQVLSDIDRSGVDEILCLGDNVGYGPDPEEVIRIIRRRHIPCVMGNHELGIVDQLYLEWFNSVARQSLILTKKLISSESVEYIRELPPFMCRHGGRFVHGAPPASVTTYLFELHAFEIQEIFQAMEENICFVGHTHILEIVEVRKDKVTFAPFEKAKVSLSGEHKYIINVGSVGQPRDGNNNAKYVIWDNAEQSIEIKYVPYDIAATAEKIYERGFPAVNAMRLW